MEAISFSFLTVYALRYTLPMPLSIGVHTMNFKAASDALFERVTHEDLAAVLGGSVASIRQARLDPDANAYRSPPEDWEKAVRALAESRVRHFQKLARSLGGRVA